MIDNYFIFADTVQMLIPRNDVSSSDLNYHQPERVNQQWFVEQNEMIRQCKRVNYRY